MVHHSRDAATATGAVGQETALGENSPRCNEAGRQNLRCRGPPLGEAARGASVVRRYVAGHSELSHLAWYSKGVEAFRSKNLPHTAGITYLDYAGAALYSRVQIEATMALLTSTLLVNPHTSPATERLIASARDDVLAFFGATSATHSVIFTSGATQALQLVGEHFAWEPGGVFLYPDESHTSVLGIREYARRVGIACGTYVLEDVASLQETNLASVARIAPEGWESVDVVLGEKTAPRLLAVAGESNFSGAKAELARVAGLRDCPHKWRVLLDAAKLACTPGALDLGVCPADFTVVSFYKIFGYPSGLGALIVRHDAAHWLSPNSWPTYFGGGSVDAVSATSTFVVPRAHLAERLERGTPHFLGIVALPAQIAAARALGSECAQRGHVLAVSREAYLRTEALRHTDGQPLCRIFGRHASPAWMEAQGPTLALLLFYADGTPVPYGLVVQSAAARGILIRAGCHCNAGACQKYLGLPDAEVRRRHAGGQRCGDDRGLFEGEATGALRLSFGRYSTLEDVRVWIALLEEEFLDKLLETVSKTDETTAQTAFDGPESFSFDKRLIAAQMPLATPLRHIEHNVQLPLRTAAPSRGSFGLVVGLKVYPIKGCGPLRVRRWPIDPATGALFLDRRWCLQLPPNADASGSRRRAKATTVSAKQTPRLTQVRIAIRWGARGRPELVLSVPSSVSKPSGGPPVPPLRVPLCWEDARILRDSGAEAEASPDENDEYDCETDASHGDNILSEAESLASAASEAGRWFGNLLRLPAVHFAAATGETPGTGEAPLSASHFANAPSTLLLVSTASLREFGRLCGLAAPADRFRANIEVDLEPAFAEAAWSVGHPVRAGRIEFEAAGRCVRCQAVDIDPDSGEATGPSLLHALATARPGGGKGPTFGVLLRHRERPSSEGTEEDNIVLVGAAATSKAMLLPAFQLLAVGEEVAA